MSASPIKSALAPVNGLQLYYEIHGTGRPLVLLHGGLGSTGMFADILPALSQDRQVIGVDLQAHGRTADIDRPLRYEAMADDIAALLRHLGIARADVMGYSLGAGVAMRAAIQHPESVRKLVAVSAPCKRSGWYPEIMITTASAGPASAEKMKNTLFYKNYERIAPRPEDWPVLHTKIAELVRHDYDWSREIAAVQIPALLAFGDADSVRPAHIVEFFDLLGGGRRDVEWDGSGRAPSRLAILPGVTHYNICSSPLLASMVVGFLEVAIPGSENS